MALTLVIVIRSQRLLITLACGAVRVLILGLRAQYRIACWIYDAVNICCFDLPQANLKQIFTRVIRGLWPLIITNCKGLRPLHIE